MHYSFHFGEVWQARDLLLHGALLTMLLSAEAMALGLVIAVGGALGRIMGPAWLRRGIGVYVEAIRNTPFLVQLFMIYFGLPALHVRLDADAAALLAMTLNVGAYAIEIVRGGLQSVGRGQTEAAAALGLGKVLTLRLVVLPQGLKRVFPPLASQFILLMLQSSVVSSIAANDLTSIGQSIEAQNFRSFEVFLTVGAIYFALSLLLSLLFRQSYVLMFGRSTP
jgi:polar amino acid transport system permease protein